MKKVYFEGADIACAESEGMLGLSAAVSETYKEDRSDSPQWLFPELFVHSSWLRHLLFHVCRISGSAVSHQLSPGSDSCLQPETARSIALLPQTLTMWVCRLPRRTFSGVAELHFPRWSHHIHARKMSRFPTHPQPSLFNCLANKA